MENFLNLLGEKVLVIDGAMGTLLSDKGFENILPEEVLLIDYNAVRKIHNDYVKAGADIVITDTFGANRSKLSEFTLEKEQKKIVHLAVKAAREATDGIAYVAGSIGPIGRFLPPFGELKNKEAFSFFKELAYLLIKEGVDLIIIETMTDLKELKTACRAVRNVSEEVPVIAQMSFDQNERAVTGTSVETFIDTVESFNLSGIGSNCGRGLSDMLKVSKKFSENSILPFTIQPNAGIPKVRDSVLEYPSTPKEMADYSRLFYENGASIIGSCCGSTPEHTRKIAEAVKGKRVIRRNIKKNIAIMTSRTESIHIGDVEGFVVIGERINPSGKKSITREIKNGKLSSVKREATRQVNAGAQALDVNISIGSPEMEKELMRKVIMSIENTENVPLLIDSEFVEVVEAGLEVYSGRTFINSITGEEEKIDKLMPLAEKYGAGFIALLIDENGVHESHVKRLKILEKILKKVELYGLTRRDIIVDPVVLTVASSQNSVFEILKTIEIVKEDFKLPTVMGLSNISYGLPGRKLVNRSFLSMAMAYGLDCAILDPLDMVLMEEIRAAEFLTGRDKDGNRYISLFKGPKIKEEREKTAAKHTLYEMILYGEKEKLKVETEKILEDKKPIEVIENILIKAMNEVGDRYDKGVYFLPQVMASAEVVKESFNIIKSRFGSGNYKKGKIVIATVKGDVHDIGKNIVKIILLSYGYEVIDLGKNVPKEVIYESVIENGPDFIALSALLTPSLLSMKETIEYIREKIDFPPVIIIGGAVVDEDFAKEINTYYGKNAISAGKLVDNLMRQ